MAGRMGKGVEGFVIDITPPPKDLAAAFDNLGKGFGDWRPAWRAMLYPVFVKGIERNLGSQGGALDDRWPELTRLYRKRKTRLGSRMMLKLSGTLRNSLKTQKMTKRLMSYGTTVPYARAVQYGKGRLGRRRFVGWTAKMKADALDIMVMHTKRMVDEAFRHMQTSIGGA